MIPGVGLATGSWRQACSLDPKLMWAGLKPATMVANLGKLEGDLSLSLHELAWCWGGVGIWVRGDRPGPESVGAGLTPGSTGSMPDAWVYGSSPAAGTAVFLA